jgi:hypothetical protein
LEQALKNVRKYVVVADPNDKLTTEIDLERPLTPSLYEITGAEEPDKE